MLINLPLQLYTENAYNLASQIELPPNATLGILQGRPFMISSSEGIQL